MQTRLRSRLGLSGSDELPDPITKARGIESSSNSTSTSLRRQSSSLDHNSLSTPVTPLLVTPSAVGANTSGKLRVKRTLSAAGATPPGASVVVLGAPSQAHVHHQLALDASQHRFDHVDAKTVVPRTQWRRVFSHFNSHNNNHVASASPQPQQQTVLFTPLSYHALQLDRRAQVQCSLQGTLLHALHRIRHEQRLGMLAADQETEFRDDILREARERKRRRKEGMFSTDGSSSAGTSSDRKKFVIVDSDESDGIGQEVEELISAPGGGSTRPSAKKATNNRKEVVAHGVDYYNDDDDDDDDSGALRILKVIDRLDIKLESFAKRNAEMAANYVRTADNEAPLTRGGRGSRRILLGGKGRRVGSAVSSGGVDNNNAGGVVWSPVMVEQGTVQTDIYPRLLPFQKEGIHWMVDTVLVRRLNCVLADEMGLGKTVSTIALASSLSQVKTIFVQDPTNAELIANARRNVVLPSTAKISKAAEQGSSSTKSFGVAKRARRAGRNAHTVSDSSNDDENSDDIDDTDDLSESEKALSKGRTTSKAAAGTASSTITPTSHARSSVVSAAIFDAAVPCPWAIAPTLVVAPLSTLPNWAAEFQNFEPNRFRVFTINGSREDREEQLDEFFTLLMALHGVSLRTTTSTGGRGRGGRGGARGDKKKSTSTTTSFNPSDRVMWGDVDPLQGAPHPIPVLLMPHDYFARALDIRGRRLVQHVQWELIVVDEAQRIKSNQSKLFQILHSIRSHHRLALSGTPLQNNVLEMFSLMEFILPDMFRSSDEGTKTLTTMLHEALRDASTTTTSSRSSGGKKLANPNCSRSMTLQEKEEELAFENQELQMLLCR
ncbi:SNF2 helicase, putative, partial [Bodo saltans]